MPFDIQRARADTPGCEKVLHFNNAGAALMPHLVLDAMIHHLHREAEMGGYEAADFASDRVENTYQAAAKLIGADPQEIAVVENATRAWDMAFYAIPFRPGDRILTGMNEYGSNYIAFLQVAQKTGARIEVIPDDEHGQISIPALKSMLDERVKLIAITHVPTNGGLVNPAAEVGQIAREANVLYLLDACQSVGQMPVDVREIGCDILSATGRKFLRGPRGIGFLFVNRRRLAELEPPFLDIHAARWVSRDRYEIRPDARRFENWETNYAAKIGLGAAIDYALAWGLEAIEERVFALAAGLRNRLKSITGVHVHDLGLVQCGIVTFTVDGWKPARIQKALQQRHVNVSVSTVFSTRLDMERRNLPEVVRASVHYYNTEEEIERFCAELERTIQ